MNGLDVKLNFSIISKLNKSAGGGSLDYSNTVSERSDFDFGTSAFDEANLFYSASRTLAASASENLDLTGVLLDPFGDVIPAAEVVAIYVKASSTNTNNVVIGGAASNPFLGPLGATGTYTIKPGEWVPFVSPSGWAVTAGTGDLLKVLNSGAGTSVTYTIVVVGRTVAA